MPDTRYPAYFFHRDGSNTRVESMEEEDALDKKVWRNKAWPTKDAPEVEPEPEPAEPEPADDLPDTLDEYTVKDAEEVIDRPEVTPRRLQKWLKAESAGKDRQGLLALLRAKLNRGEQP